MKYAALMEIDRMFSNKDVLKKFNVPKSTLLTWKKNREKIIATFKTSRCTRNRRVREATNKRRNIQASEFSLLKMVTNTEI